MTEETKRRIEFLFPPETRAEAALLIERDCGNGLPFLNKATPVELERYRFAALKISEGDIVKLRRAIEVANQDWRDLLVGAGFADSVTAYLRWEPVKDGIKYQSSR